MSQEGLNVGVKDLEAVFDTIDFDSSGTIDVEEFIFGMSQLSAELCIWLFRILTDSVHKVETDMSRDWRRVSVSGAGEDLAILSSFFDNKHIFIDSCRLSLDSEYATLGENK